MRALEARRTVGDRGRPGAAAPARLGAVAVDQLDVAGAAPARDLGLDAVAAAAALLDGAAVLGGVDRLVRLAPGRPADQDRQVVEPLGHRPAEHRRVDKALGRHAQLGGGGQRGRPDAGAPHRVHRRQGRHLDGHLLAGREPAQRHAVRERVLAAVHDQVPDEAALGADHVEDQRLVVDLAPAGGGSGHGRQLQRVVVVGGHRAELERRRVVDCLAALRDRRLAGVAAAVRPVVTVVRRAPVVAVAALVTAPAAGGEHGQQQREEQGSTAHLP
jgi:hypothetical protein